jgi:Transposase domain (DUF772)
MPECLDDFIAEDNSVRVVVAFVEELDLQDLGFDGFRPACTGRPAHHPAVLLKIYIYIYIYGYLNRIQSSRRLERECQRNLELMWLTGRLAPDFKTIADFRRDDGKSIRNPPEHALMLSCDEKSQIQVLNRTQPGLPMKTGRAGTITHDYKRHGTTTLFAALNTLDGRVISMCQPRHRHEEWLKFLRLIDRKKPRA